MIRIRSSPHSFSLSYSFFTARELLPKDYVGENLLKANSNTILMIYYLSVDRLRAFNLHYIIM